MKIAMKSTPTAPSANAIGAPENINSSVTAVKASPRASIDIGVQRPAPAGGRAIALKLAAACTTNCSETSVIPSAISPYGIHSGGAHDDEVVWPSTQASCSSVHDFQ